MMRHFYKTHGSHCFLRSFKTECPSCGEEVLYWECSHGCKVFFEYPPYGKLIKHRCKNYKKKNSRKNYKVIVKTPNKILKNHSISCPVCGKLFREKSYLANHIDQLKNYDFQHKYYSENNTLFKRRKKESAKNQNEDYSPKFGMINIKRKKQ